MARSALLDVTLNNEVEQEQVLEKWRQISDMDSVAILGDFKGIKAE